MFPNELHGVSYITSRRKALMWMDSETPGQNQFFVLVSCPLYMHSKINVFTFGGAKRSGSNRECKYFPISMNAREPLWR